jgi:hypothetical protein
MPGSWESGPKNLNDETFWQCLPWWKRPLATFGQWFANDLFALDREFLKDIAEARTRPQVLLLLEAFRYQWENHAKVSFRWLGLRISGRKLIEAAAILPRTDGYFAAAVARPTLVMSAC